MADDWDCGGRLPPDERPTMPPVPGPTNQDIINALGSFSLEIRQSVERIEANTALIHGQVSSNTRRISELETRVDALEEMARARSDA